MSDAAAADPIVPLAQPPEAAAAPQPPKPPRPRRPRLPKPEDEYLRFSAPRLIGGGPTRALDVGDRFTIRDSAANNGRFEVTARDVSWVTVDRFVTDEPPNPHATLTIDEED